MALHSTFFADDSVTTAPVVAAARPSASAAVAASAAPGSARARIDETAGLQLFGAVRVPASAVAPAPMPPASAAAPEPPIPVLPGALRGVLRAPQGATRVLIEGADGQVRAIAAGEMVDAEWRLLALDPRHVTVEHLPTRTQQVVALPAES